MHKYVLRRTALLLDRFATQLKRTAEAVDPDSIHDLRVSIRRLSRCLRVFSPFYPRGSWKRIRRQLSELMHAAGAVRDRDIALELLAQSGIPQGADIVKQLAAERRTAAAHLQAELHRWRKRSYPHKWRTTLNL